MYILTYKETGDIFILYRGVFNPRQMVRLVTNKKLVKFPNISDDIQIHSGCLEIYEDTRELCMEALRKNITKDTKNIYLVGHSIGAPLVTLTMIDLFNSEMYKKYKISLHGFAFTPLYCGDRNFSTYFNKYLKERNNEYISFINLTDLYTLFPFTEQETHVGTLYFIDKNYGTSQKNHRLNTFLVELAKKLNCPFSKKGYYDVGQYGSWHP